METAKFSVRDFRARFGALSEADQAIAVTKHGRTVGFYIPVPQPAAADVAAYHAAHEKLQAWMAERGVSGEELAQKVQRKRKEKRRRG